MLLSLTAWYSPLFNMPQDANVLGIAVLRGRLDEMNDRFSTLARRMCDWYEAQRPRRALP